MKPLYHVVLVNPRQHFFFWENEFDLLKKIKGNGKQQQQNPIWRMKRESYKQTVQEKFQKTIVLSWS